MSNIWNLKDKKEDFSLQRSIAAKALFYHPDGKLCHLCLTEKDFDFNPFTPTSAEQEK